MRRLTSWYKDLFANGWGRRAALLPGGNPRAGEACDRRSVENESSASGARSQTLRQLPRQPRGLDLLRRLLQIVGDAAEVDLEVPVEVQDREACPRIAVLGTAHTSRIHE